MHVCNTIVVQKVHATYNKITAPRALSQSGYGTMQKVYVQGLLYSTSPGSIRIVMRSTHLLRIKEDHRQVQKDKPKIQSSSYFSYRETTKATSPPWRISSDSETISQLRSPSTYCQ